MAKQVATLSDLFQDYINVAVAIPKQSSYKLCLVQRMTASLSSLRKVWQAFGQKVL